MRFSDHILELSGIGHPDVPKRIGVPLKVELPGIGENVQDHMFACKSSSKHFLNEILWRWPIGISYELDQNVPHETFDGSRDPDFAKEQGRLQYICEIILSPDINLNLCL